MIDPEELETKQEFELNIRAAFPIQDPDQSFVDNLQKKLADRFKELQQSAEDKNKMPRRLPWLDKGKLLFSPLAWGAIAIIFIAFLVWGIKTLIPKVEPSLSTKTTPSPTIVSTLAPTQSTEPTMAPTQSEGVENVIELPTKLGQAVTQPEAAISAVNASQITELARWGREPIAAMAWAPDGMTFAIVTSTDIHIYDSASLKEINTIGNGTSVYYIAYSPDGTKLAAGSYDSPVTIWDVANGKALLTLEGNQEMITGLAFSPEGVILITGRYDLGGPITLWDASSGQKLRTLCESAGYLFAFSPDWSTLATVDGRTIKLWDVTSGKELRTLIGHTEDIYGLTFSQDGSRLASWQSGMEMIINLWEVATGNLQSTINVQEYINNVMFLPDGSTLVAKAGRKPITLWDTASGQALRTIGDDTQGGNIVLSPDGKTVFYYGQDGDPIEIYDIASGEELNRLEMQIYVSSSLAFSHDGSIVAAGLNSGSIKFLDATNGQALRTLTGHTNAVNSLAFSPDGILLASGSSDSTNRLWDATTGEQLFSMEGVKEFGWGVGAVPSVDFSPDGKLLALGGASGQVMLWDVTDQVELRTLGGQAGGTATDAVAAVAFSPDGKILASGYDVPSWGYPSHLITLWDPLNGQELRSLEYYNNQQLNVSSLAFSPDGKTLAAGYWEAKVTLWDVASGNELYTVSFSLQDEISSVAFSPAGDVLAIGCGLANIVLLDADSGQQLASLPSNAYVLAFSPDGKLLISDSYDGYIRLWGIPPGNTIAAEATATSAEEGTVSTPSIETQVAPEDIGMEKIPIPILLTGEGLQSWWWSSDGSYFAYSQQGTIGEAGPDQATTTLYFLDARTGEICQGIQETLTFTQTEWGPSPIGSAMFERTFWMDDNHLLYISPDKELLVLSPCSDATEDWTASLPDVVSSFRTTNVKEDGSQIILQGEQGFWLFSPASQQSVKLNIPLPQEGVESGVGWLPGEEELYIKRIEDRQGEWWIVLERLDPETGKVSLILETQASPEIQNSYPMWASTEWLSKDKVIVDHTLTGMQLFDLTSQPPQVTNLFPDVFGIEYPGMGQVSAWGRMCGTGEQDYHWMFQTDFGQDGQYYIYHADTGAVDQYPLDPPLLVVYPCGEGGVVQSYMQASPSNNTYKVIMVDSGMEPYDLVAKGHMFGQNAWSFNTILPGAEKVMFSSVQGISLVDLKTGETLNFWGLDDQMEYQDFTAMLSPDGKSVVGFASQKGEQPGAGSPIQDIYWLRLEP
jgi:WD40 repeat protein